MFLPLPDYINKVDQRNANYSLLFNKWVKFGGSFNSPKKLGDKKSDELIRLKREFEKRKAQLKEISALQKNKVANILSILKSKGWFVTIIKCKVSDALICGIGDEHPLENSIRFDHCSGLPYIPSSSIKGVARFAGEFNNETDKREEGKENVIFGSQGSVGKVQFWDAFPTDVPKLKIDIMNNHFQDYYSDSTGTKAPSDDMNPNPVPFIVVDADSEFYFPVIAKDKDNLVKAVEFLKCALTDWGVGAKSSVGYGIFYDLTEESISLPKPKPKKLSAFESAFEELKKTPNPEKFVEFVKSLKSEEIDSLQNISFKGMDSINTGLVPYLDGLEVSSDVLTAIAEKMLEVIQPKKKWNDAKREKYNKLLSMAGKEMKY